MIGKINQSVAASLLFLAVLGIYLASPVVTSFDSRWTVPTACSLIREGNTDLDEYPDLLVSEKGYGIEVIDGRHYSMFPVGVSLLAAPLVLVLDRVAAWSGHPIDLIAHRGRVEQFVASFITALMAVVLFLLLTSMFDVRPACIAMPARIAARSATGGRSIAGRCSMLGVLLFSFGTSAWSVASRALWQHGPSMLFLSMALYLLLAARRRPGLIQYLSLPLAAAYAVRPANSISVLVLTVYVFLAHRRFFLRYLLWSLPLALPFVAHNLLLYHALLPSYFLPGRVGAHSRFLEALAGNLISPARGLFVFSPVLLFGLVGLVRTCRAGRMTLLDWSLVTILVLHWLLISSFPHWWAGHSYGPRFFSDMLPFLVYFLAAGLPTARPGKIVFAILVVVSVAIHFRGATSNAVHAWNTVPVNVDRHPERIWNWRDPPFLR